MHGNDTQVLRVETVQQEHSDFHQYNVMVLLEWSVLPIEQGMAAATKETTRENSDRVDMDTSANKFPRMADRCKVCLTTQDRPYFVTQ